MKTTFISTLSFYSTPRGSLPKLQQDLANASTEISTGRYADVGLKLGIRTGDSVSLRTQYNTLQTLLDGNALATAQLDQTTTALNDMSSSASSFLKDLLAAPAENTNVGGLVATATSQLDSLIGTLNSSDGRRYAFGGVNSAVPPMNDYSGAPKTAVDAAFLAKFGITQDDPAVADISTADMQDFLDNEFSDLFADPAWGTDWSNASSTNRTSLISSSERIEVSTNANETAMRNLAKAYTMMSQLGNASMSTPVLQAVMNTAQKVIGAAINQVTTLGAAVGMAQRRVDASNTMMETAQDIATKRISALEDVDPAEAKTRADALTSQIQMSYSMTTQIMGLSILNYA
jgi:flagellar hook-associated protein 3 FlgL